MDDATEPFLVATDSPGGGDLVVVRGPASQTARSSATHLLTCVPGFGVDLVEGGLAWLEVVARVVVALFVP